MRGRWLSWLQSTFREIVGHMCLSNTNKQRPPCFHAPFLQNDGIDANRSMFISIYITNCDATSSVHHYIDGTEEHLSPSEHALGSGIELYTCVFIPVRFLLCWTYPQLLLCYPLQLPPLSMSGCQRGEGVGDSSSAAQPSHASVIILAVAVLIGAPVSGPAVGEWSAILWDTQVCRWSIAPLIQQQNG